MALSSALVLLFDPIHAEADGPRGLRCENAQSADTCAYDRDRFLNYAIGPRLSGSLQADAGVRYLAAQLNALGLKVRLEPVTVAHWVRGEESAALVDWPRRMAETTQEIVLTPPGMSVATPEAGLTAPVVVVKNFDELKSLGESMRGKIVLHDVQFDERLEAAGYRFAGPSVASKLGAVATLVRSLGGADYDCRTRLSRSVSVRKSTSGRS